jgi:hypothetical protein
MTRIGGYLAGAVGENAGDVLELNRAVSDAEGAQDFIDALENRFAF